jgi:hypothetical protein
MSSRHRVRARFRSAIQAGVLAAIFSTQAHAVELDLRVLGVYNGGVSLEQDWDAP